MSSILQGAYGLQDICISFPTVVGVAGVCGHPEFEILPRELHGLRNSAKLLRETLGRLAL